MTDRDAGSYLEWLMRLDTSALPPDGGERFNRLIFARSPYLLQHAENPVAWYEWGDEAFASAREKRLPVFLSIGYATCHWCHVMARESFGDRQVADLLNRHFISIKVDREERPDIDDFYMTVSQVMTGSGGWPLNLFMTPERHPFMAFTYLPKEGRDGMSGFMELLANIAAIWRQRPDMVERNCRSVMTALADLSPPVAVGPADTASAGADAFEQLQRLYDPEWGGVGRAPKFPMPTYLGWLLELGAGGNGDALEMARHTLACIERGGISDHLGGGLHRYSVDRQWLTPHFEKMLYDQALVSLVLLEAFQVTGDEGYLALAGRIVGFVERELTAADGGFYSALDADSEGEEGRFYLWKRDEVERILGEDAGLFCRFHAITPEGNSGGRSILNTPRPLEEFCRREGRDRRETEQILERCRALLLAHRDRRTRPLRDEKIITAWNGLMIGALARYGRVRGDAAFVEQADRAARFVLERLRRPDGRLLRSFRGEAGDIPGFLEDYACILFGLLELYEATLEATWLERGLALAEQAVGLFLDPEDATLATIGRDGEQMPCSLPLERDTVMPSAVSQAVTALIRLGRSSGRDDLVESARRVLERYGADVRQHPLAHVGMLRAETLLTAEPFEIRFCGRRDDPELAPLLQVMASRYLPERVLRFEQHDGPATVTLCGRGVCRPAEADATRLRELLDGLLGPQRRGTAGIQGG